MSERDIYQEIRQHLPRFLSDESIEALYEELNQFPDNIDNRLYTQSLSRKSEFLQGDGVRDMLVVTLPQTKAGHAPCLLLSNSCDISQFNKRLAQMRVLYAPILRLDKTEEALRTYGSAQQVNNYVDSIRKQRVSNVFYLPSGAKLDYEGIVRFDMTQNGPISQLDPDDIGPQRLFSLSMYGFYLFLLKLSIHFTRIRENVLRE